MSPAGKILGNLSPNGGVTLPLTSSFTVLDNAWIPTIQSTLTVTGNAFRVGGSTLVVTNGKLLVGGAAEYSSKLSVAGNISTTGQVISSGTGKNYFAGGVGIGTTTTAYPLTVYNPTGVYPVLMTGLGFDAMLYFNQDLVTKAGIGYRADEGIALYESGSDSVLVRNGYVSIGGGIPQAALTVNGNIASSGTVYAQNGFYGSGANLTGVVLTTFTFPGGDNLGSHMATQIIVANYGITSTTGISAGYFQINGTTVIAHAWLGGDEKGLMIGAQAGNNYTAGSTGGNVFIGPAAGYASNSNADMNIAIGPKSMWYSETGDYNTVMGADAGYGASGQSFSSCTLIGALAGYGSIGGASGNTVIGYKAGYSISVGTNNLVIGHDQDVSAPSASNELNIGGVLRGSLADTGNNITILGTATITGAGFNVNRGTLTVSGGFVGVRTISPLGPLDVVDGILTQSTGKRFAIDTAGTLLTNLYSYYNFDSTYNDFYASVHTTAHGTGNSFNTVNKASGTASLLINGSGWAGAEDSYDLAYNQGFSISVWVKHGSGNYTYVAKQDDWSGHTSKGWILLYYGGRIYWQINIGAAGYGSNEVQNNWITTTPADGNWHHIVITASNVGVYSTYKCYVDNSEKTLSDYNGSLTSGSTDNTDDLSMGAEATGTLALVGYIDEVGLWSKALSATEVSNLYNSGAADQMQNTTSTAYVDKHIITVAGNNTGYVGINNAYPQNLVHISSGTLYVDGAGGAIWSTGPVTAASGYFINEVSASSFTDRTPYPETLELAYAEVESIVRDSKNPKKIDTTKLHPNLVVGKLKTVVDYIEEVEISTVAFSTVTHQMESYTYKQYTPHFKNVAIGEVGRNLSETVSALVEIVKDLRNRISVLEKK